MAANRSFALGLGADLSVPGFRDFALAVGAEASIRDTVFLRASYLFDAAEAFGDLPQPSLPFSFGATVRLKTALKEDIDVLDFTARGWNRSEVRINISATPMPGDVWAFGLGVNIPLGVHRQGSAQGQRRRRAARLDVAEPGRRQGRLRHLPRRSRTSATSRATASSSPTRRDGRSARS